MGNPYWEAVEGLVEWDSDLPLDPGPAVVGMSHWLARDGFVRQWTWTITDPDSVQFVHQYAGTHLLDPMAGSGYWARLLAGLGVDVLAYDAHPPLTKKNRHHHTEHYPVLLGDAAEMAWIHADRTLLLSWPPYDTDLAEKCLRNYGGHRLIYIGEGTGGCCADDGFFELLGSDWHLVAERRPVQWAGLHDYIQVYDRKGNC